MKTRHDGASGARIKNRIALMIPLVFVRTISISQLRDPRKFMGSETGHSQFTKDIHNLSHATYLVAFSQNILFQVYE